MQKNLLIKLSVIGVLCLIFAVVLSMIQSLVYERQRNADAVIEEIKEQHVNAQHVITPFLVQSTATTHCNKSIKNKNSTNPANATDQLCSTDIRLASLVSTQTQATQNLDVSDDNYKRGIYGAISYTGNLNFKQQYDLNKLSQDGLITVNEDVNSTAKAAVTNVAKTSNTQIDKTLFLLIPVSDLRGVMQMPTVTINGESHQAKYPNIPLLAQLNYLEVQLPDSVFDSSSVQIDINVPIAGMSEIQTIPLAEQFMLNSQSNWHAPNFVGQALPTQKTINKQGFNASWQNQHLTVENNKLVNTCIELSQGYCDINFSDNRSKSSAEVKTYTGVNEKGKEITYHEVTLNSFDVQFAKPNDVYHQTERSMKYALLIIVVSFGSFFLFEVIKSLRIHPIQYLLVSMALLVFYVLLLSLAEQIAFWQAYSIASVACTGLIGWYAYYVLHSVSRAGLFTLILAGQYAGFYTILTMEDLNLLIGAILCFVMIASVMFLTRNINWYEINQ